MHYRNCSVAIVAAPTNHIPELDTILVEHSEVAARYSSRFPIDWHTVCDWSHHRPRFALNDSKRVRVYHLQVSKQLCRAVVNTFI
jgi:hypothetical protein